MSVRYKLKKSEIHLWATLSNCLLGKVSLLSNDTTSVAKSNQVLMIGELEGSYY